MTRGNARRRSDWLGAVCYVCLTSECGDPHETRFVQIRCELKARRVERHRQRSVRAAVRSLSSDQLRHQQSASPIGRSGSSAFRLSTITASMSLRGLVLLFGISTRALPSWVSKTRWNNLKNGLAVRTYGRSKQTDGLISSIVPRGTSFHRSVEVSLIAPLFAYGPLPRNAPAETGPPMPD
jgi:hypothetical protein